MDKIVENIGMRQRVPAPMVRLRSSSLQMLDFWRGIACIAVVLFHWTIQWDAGHHGLGQINPLHIVLMHGYLGVQVFFVISGYCITAAAINTLEHGKGALSFLKARCWR